jgi:hypothetical protein
MTKQITKSVVLILHSNALKAAQRWERAAPGTRKQELARRSWDNAERKFIAAIDIILDDE